MPLTPIVIREISQPSSGRKSIRVVAPDSPAISLWLWGMDSISRMQLWYPLLQPLSMECNGGH